MQEFTGLEYIKIDIANQYGLDKLSWKERIEWVDAQDDLFEIIEDAENPMLMLKAVMAMQDALAGEPTGFIMGLDATASGLQIMACLTNCHTTAKNVNLINTGKREDVYTNAAINMGVSRDLIKKPLMTTFYGSIEQPISVFGVGSPELKAFYKMLNTELPGAMECMNDMQSCWDRKALNYTWELPDWHTVYMPVMGHKDFKVELAELDKATFTFRTLVNAPQDFGLSLAANITHSIDGYIVREMYRRCYAQGFNILTIHDSFWASPNNMNKVRRNYIEILASIADSNLLQDILRQITKNPKLNHKKSGSNLSSKILESEYALS